MPQNNNLIWLNGNFIPWHEATIHCITHTLHYGYGVLEGVRVYETPRGPSIFRLIDHTDRLFRSAKILNLSLKFSQEQINEAQKELIRRNKLSSAYIRPLIFCGADHLSLDITSISTNIMIAAWEINQTYFGGATFNKGIKARISTFLRNHQLSKAKACANYMNSILALQEAKITGCHDAIFLDQQGYVAEATGANIFYVRDNILYTPQTTSILPGITRDTVIYLAHKDGFVVKEKNITRDDLYVADEVFLTGTSVEVTPVYEIDGRLIGNGEPGNVTKQLQTMYRNVATAKTEVEPRWLNFL